MRFSYCIFDTFRVPGGRVRLAVSAGQHCPVPGASAVHRPPWAEPCTCAFDASSLRTLKKSNTTLLVAMLVQDLLLNCKRSYYILNEKGLR